MISAYSSRISIASISNTLLIVYGRIFSYKLIVPSTFLYSGIQSTMYSTKGSIKVAICGSGIAGSMAAHILAKDSRLAVTVFEAGRGPGGRSSTRRAGDFVFDHGAQFISLPKDANFVPIFTDWREKNLISQWNGTFGTMRSSSTEIEFSDLKSSKFVGCPHMNSISKYLLSPDSSATPISCVFGQRIRAEPILLGTDDFAPSGWKILCAVTNKSLGDFDVLISGDRGFKVLSDGDLSSLPKILPACLRELKEEYINSIQAAVSSSPILANMIVLRHSLPRDVFPFDGVTFLPAASGVGSILGWIARDSSKPGRARQDGKECWVVQSNTEYAAAVISEVKADPAFSGRSSEDVKQEVNSRANAALTQAFRDFIAQHSGQVLDSSNVVDVELSMGHRWSAAFPSLKDKKPSSDMRCYVNMNARFIACGDYFDGSSPGRIKSAAVSGLEAAKHLLQGLQSIHP